MNLNQLTYFVTLAQIENYTRAAKRLDITQPSLSHAISNLEKELQVPLFERHGRNVTMTKYGEMFLKYVQDSLHIPVSYTHLDVYKRQDFYILHKLNLFSMLDFTNALYTCTYQMKNEAGGKL